MTFAESVSTCLNKYADFSGRASRSEFWWFALASLLAMFIGSAIAPALGALLWLGLIIPYLAAGIRRLHDTNRSGWFWLLGLIPLIGGIIVLVFLATAGDTGPNNYGEAPAA